MRTLANTALGLDRYYTDPSRDLWIRLPDGRRVKFSFYLEGAIDGSAGVFQARYAAPLGVNATLEVLDAEGNVGGNRVRYDSLFNGFYWDAQPPAFGASGGGQYDYYDLPGYRLTLPDGTQFYLGKTELPDTAGYGPRYAQIGESAEAVALVSHVYANDLHLTKIVDANGNTLILGSDGHGRDGISSTDADLGLTFVRDSAGRLTKVIDSDDAVLLQYAYNGQGDLVSVTRLVTRATTGENPTPATYATTSYIYQQTTAGSTHIIQSIKSPSGKQPILNKYDERGRLIETVDAFGNSIYYRPEGGRKFFCRQGKSVLSCVPWPDKLALRPQDTSTTCSTAPPDAL